MTNDNELNVGDHVEKVGGDYTFVGVIVAKFAKLSGAIRYVVEDDRGVLHVYSAKVLRKAESANRIRWEEQKLFDITCETGYLGSSWLFTIYPWQRRDIYELSSLFNKWQPIKRSSDNDDLKHYAEEHLADWVDQAGLIFKPSPIDEA